MISDIILAAGSSARMGAKNAASLGDQPQVEDRTGKQTLVRVALQIGQTQITRERKGYIRFKTPPI